MADYSVNLKIAIDGAKELQRTRVETKLLARDIKRLNTNAQKDSKNVVRNFDNLSKEVSRANTALNEAAIGTDQFNDAVKNVVKVEEEFNKEMKIRNDRLKAERFAKQKGITVDQAIIKLRQQEIDAENKLAAAKKKTENAEKRKRIGSTISSAAIGGAFPLLFGQTGAAAVGGGIGGAAGGLIGGQFGFALSIVGTAVGQFTTQQDKMNQSVAQLDVVLRNAGSSAGFTRDNIKELATTLNVTKDEAIQMASAFARFGDTGQAASFIFGKNPNTFKNLAAIQDTKTAMTAILDTSNNLSIQQQIQLLREAKTTGFKNLQFEVTKAILEANLQAELSIARQIKNTDRVRFLLSEFVRITNLIATFGQVDLGKIDPGLFLNAAERMEQRVAKVLEKFDELEVGLPTIQELMKDLNLEMESMSFSIPTAMDKTSAELRKLMSTSFMVVTAAETIGDAFGESFKGIVKGTMTAQDALRNLFQRTADAFLDMAAQMIAKQIQLKILGIGFNFLGSKQVTDTVFTPSVNSVIDNPFELPKLAGGGMAKAGRTHLVGERGPELFTPGVSGMVTPNHALGGSTTVVVNVDASGSSVEGDEEQANQFGSAIATAIQSELIEQKRPGGLLA